MLLVAALADRVVQRQDDPRAASCGRVGIVVGVPAVLIVLQPDLGTTLALIASVAHRAVPRRASSCGGSSAPSQSWSAFGGAGDRGRALPDRARHRRSSTRGPTRRARATRPIQALLAFGTGGIDGVGLGLSRQKFFYLPEAHTDFIFAIIGEEVGLLGTLAVVCGVRRSSRTRASGSRSALATRSAGWSPAASPACSAFQATLNMAAVTGLMPVTGKPLPFVSYGGSSMLVTMICIWV